MNASDPGSGPRDSTLTNLARALVALGCPPERSHEMARQLDKRADQLAAQKGCSHDEALTHLLNLMKQGWAAGDRGIPPAK